MAIEFPYTVVRRPRRRSVTLTISSQNHLTLTVPQNFSESRILEFLDRQANWIEKKVLRNQELARIYPPRTYETGDLFYYLGEAYSLEILEADQRKIGLEAGKLLLADRVSEIRGEDGETVASMIRAWYEGMAHQVLHQRVAYFREQMKVKVAAVRVRMLESQWGSCAISGNLSFNARLVMAPLEIVDYVVVHELSHVLHHNHSPRFWQCVEAVLPDYRRRRRWLRDHGQFLRL
jgi:predicted metal-dependent hydrolase